MTAAGAGGRRVLLVGINYRPELTAVGPYTAGLAEHLARRGDEVTVVTGLPHYPAWRIAPGTPRRLWSRTQLEGVTVVRSAHYVPARQSAVRRAAYEGTFGLTGLVAGLALPAPDAVVGVVPSLSGGVLARVLAARFGRPYGLLFQDLMGPAASESGVPGGGAVARAVGAVERWAVDGASAVAVVATAFIPYLRRAGIPERRIHHVPNWSRALAPTLAADEVRARFGWTDGRQVVLHAGNIGFKQGLEQVVGAARRAAASGEPVRFVLSGGGNRAEAVRELAAGLPNVDFLGVQPDGVHASLMAAADVLLLSERATQLDMSLPSKLTSYFASGRPILAAVPPGGPTAGEVARSGAGLAVPAGDGDGLLAALRTLREDLRLAARLGANGTAYAVGTTSAATCLERAAAFVDAVAGADRTPMEAAA